MQIHVQTAAYQAYWRLLSVALKAIFKLKSIAVYVVDRTSIVEVIYLSSYKGID